MGKTDTGSWYFLAVNDKGDLAVAWKKNDGHDLIIDEDEFEKNENSALPPTGNAEFVCGNLGLLP